MDNEVRYLKLFEAEIVTLLSIPDEQRSKIITALLSASIGKAPPKLDAMESAVYELMLGQVNRARESSQKYRQNANKRWENANGMQTLCKDDTNLYTNTNTKTNTNTITITKTSLPAADASGGVVSEKKSEKSSVSALEEGFERFWSSYPRKTSKQNALKAWKRLKPDEKLTETILSALERFKGSPQWQKDGGQFIPYPTTWLNGRRWEDIECESPQNNANNANKRQSTFDINDIMKKIKSQYADTPAAVESKSPPS